MRQAIKNMGKNDIFQSLELLIEVIIRMGIQELLGIELEKQEKDKLNQARKYTSELKKQVGLAMLLAFFTGGSSMIPTGRASGGSVQKNQPYMVGENGPEMFIPNSSGQITQSARGTGGGETNVNFTINATDVRGVKELLIDNRATIVNVINSALNEKGKEALV